jgi:hypothetical protein
MRISHVVLSGVAIVAFAALASAQMTKPYNLNLKPAAGPDVAQLQAEVTQLQNQVQTLQTQLGQTTKTANEAYARAGLSMLWIGANGDGSAKASAWVAANGTQAAQVAGAYPQIMQVVNAYPHHKHGYQMANTSYVNHSDCGGVNCSQITGNHIDNLTTTDPQ